MASVWLGLGSNRGDSAALLESAARMLAGSLAGMRVSGTWRSRARYVEDQPDFLNMAVAGETDLEPRALLAEVNRIESEFGRDRSRESVKGPRTLDIDILLYGGRIVVEDGLIIPHPGIRERKFVLLPLLELDPALKDPVSGDSLLSWLAILPPQGIYPLGRSRYDGPYP